MSTGVDSTLGNWYDLAKSFFGEQSKPALFLAEKIAATPKGRDEEVIADEQQLLQVLLSMS